MSVQEAYAKTLVALIAPLFREGTEFETKVDSGHIKIRIDEPGRRILIKITQNALDDALMHPDLSSMAEQRFLAFVREMQKHKPEKQEQWDVTYATVRP